MPDSNENDGFGDCDDLGSPSQEASSLLDFGFGSAQIDSITWQRLVSSSLPTEAYHDLLVKMECQPELWRDCALAFLEEQALREAFAGVTGRDFSTRNFDSSNESLPGLAPYSTDTNTTTAEFSSVESAKYERCDQSIDETSMDLSSLRPARMPGFDRSKNHLTRTIAIPLAAAAAGFLLSFGLFAVIDPAGFQPIASNIPSDSADTTTAPETQLLAATGGNGIGGSNILGNNIGGSNSVDRELNGIISELSDTDRQRLLASPSRQKIRATVPASPAIAVPGDWNSSRHFLFYRIEDNRQFVLAVDSHQYVAGEVQ